MIIHDWEVKHLALLAQRSANSNYHNPCLTKNSFCTIVELSLCISSSYLTGGCAGFQGTGVQTQHGLVGDWTNIVFVGRL
jgi:hypothetical protein